MNFLIKQSGDKERHFLAGISYKRSEIEKSNYFTLVNKVSKRTIQKATNTGFFELENPNSNFCARDNILFLKKKYMKEQTRYIISE